MVFSFKKILNIFVITILCCTIITTTGMVVRDTADVQAFSSPIFANHTVINAVRLDTIPDSAILKAKSDLHIAYAHTSHGSQVTDGMTGLSAFKEGLGGTEGLYDWNNGGEDGALDLHDYFVSGDLGNPDRTTWATRTQEYLNQASNSDVNVIMWSWCGQVSGASEDDIDTYLGLMAELEIKYSDVHFVYMTGHVDGSGLEGNLHLRNEQIRDFCAANNKILFDFADIESYDPDGNYFGDKYVLDSCEYDTNNDTNPWGDGNWATEWQDGHTEDTDWYDCGSAHSEPLNANMKAYAAWWLWATIAGWDDPNHTPILTTPTPYPTPNASLPLPIFGSLLGLGIVTLIAFSTVLVVNKKGKFNHLHD